MSALDAAKEPAELAPVARVVAGFAPASADELERVALQRRFDRKFLAPTVECAALLAGLVDDYRVVLAGDARLAQYDTVYFDTDDLRCFHDHRRKRRPRVKLRVRHYRDRGLSVLEVKQKTARGDTLKHRWPRAYGDEALASAEDLARLRAVCPPTLPVEALRPQARTVFYRLMLVGVRSAERVTLDFSVAFERDERRRTLERSVVVEVKDVGRAQDSPFVRALRTHHARPRAVSKYCAAVALFERARVNAFLPALRALEGALR